MNDPRWVPVKVRMPPKNGDYLATCHIEGKRAKVHRCRFIGGRFNCLSVIAWMEEPAPYEEPK